MVSIRIIVRAQPATQVRIASIKSTNVTQIHARMVEHAPITITIIHAIVHMDSLEKIVPNMLIGVHKIHVKTVHRVHNVKTPINVVVCLAGPENYVTSKWFHAKMLLFERVSAQKNYVTMELVKTLAIRINVIVIWVTLDRIVRRKSTNVNRNHVKMVAHAKI